MENDNYKETYNELFPDKRKKVECFDKIAAMFYDKNFGTATKSEIELQMFSIFMDAMIEQNKNDEYVLDYNACSDFKISKILGIHHEKLRMLKVKNQARYPKKMTVVNCLNLLRIMLFTTKRRISL